MWIIKEKNSLDFEKGITLVALIITIIVLIILAAVSINAVFKANFIDLATEGTINYANSQSYEQKVMDDVADLTNKVISSINGDKSNDKEDENPSISNRKILSYTSKSYDPILNKTMLKDLTNNGNDATLYNTKTLEDKSGIIFNRKYKLCTNTVKR